MKKYAYPAVIYCDNEAGAYSIALHDVQIYTGGDTVEQAHERARKYLDMYLECALKYGAEIPAPSDFGEVVTKYHKYLVILVESTINDKNKAV